MEENYMLNESNAKFKKFVDAYCYDIATITAESEQVEWLHREQLYVLELYEELKLKYWQEISQATLLNEDLKLSLEELMTGGYHVLAVRFYKRHLGLSQGSKQTMTIQAKDVKKKLKPKDFIQLMEVGKMYDLPEGMSAAGVVGAGYKAGMKISAPLIEGKCMLYRKA